MPSFKAQEMEDPLSQSSRAPRKRRGQKPPKPPKPSVGEEEAGDALTSSGRVLRTRNIKVAAASSSQSQCSTTAAVPATTGTNFELSKSDHNTADASSLYRRINYASMTMDELDDPLSQSGRAPRSRRREPFKKAPAKEKAAEEDDFLSQSGRAPRKRRPIPASAKSNYVLSSPSMDAMDEVDDPLSQSSRAPRSRRRAPAKPPANQPLSLSDRAPRAQAGGGGGNVFSRRNSGGSSLSGASKPKGFGRRMLGTLSKGMSRRFKGSMDEDD